ncbi:unnamed protein product [Adineta steineri]|uniref:Tudor domain-containing protein n=1 Tax=Adineta steineri TaxID=433720 RepID=A0A818FI53_9BILA|nr:unnamed protein product [Adineta steineri]CAF3475895.1 unnamed protein product [Adineta steineri]
MVTVIADKDDLTTPVNNGVNAGLNDNERPSLYIKDYQEVDFHRSSSCKPLPEDLFGTANDRKMKSSIKGTFFVQIDGIEPTIEFSNNNQQTNDNSSLLLTLTDGIITVKGITIDDIPDLSFNIRPGCKLLLTGVIPIKDGLLQLTHDNTRFQYGSNTYPRPRSAYRGRGGGSYRPSYEGRRGGGGGNNSTRHDNDDNESNFLKRPPPKNTLMDFMTSLKISNDTKQINDNNDNQKSKERFENKRQNTEQYYQTNKTNNGINNTTNSLITTNSNHSYQTNNQNNYTDQITFQQDPINNDQLESEDDPSHSNYRERRNPLPPRLQRAHEERTRRNTNRYYDGSILVPGGELNDNYHNGTTNNHALSSSSYSRRGDQTSYLANNSTTNQQHSTALNYVPHANMLATVNGSTPTHLAYFQANPGPLAYSLSGIPNASFHNQQPSIGPSYTNDHLTYCYGTPYAPPTYLPTTSINGFNNDSKAYNNPSVLQTNSSVDENEKKSTNESQQDDNNNDIENKSQSLSSEQKVNSASSASSTSSSNDGNTNSQQIVNEQHEDKQRDSHPNPRPRWRIGDVCLARWNEDRQFYPANIVQIQPPYCTVVFRDYNNYEQVHFGDLKIFPRDQQYYQLIPPVVGPTSDLNPLAANTFFPTRTNYYPSGIDGCIMMPEAPPFPFNSAGTLYMCPPTLTSVSRSNRYHTNDFSSFQQSNRRMENGNINSNNDTIINSSLSPSKDSNDTGIIDSTTTSVDDNQQIQHHQDISLPTQELRPCSIADAPFKLVTRDDERERSTSTESITSSRYDEEQSTNQEEKQENNSVVNIS